MIRGIGVDMVSISEMKQLMDALSESALCKMFTQMELEASRCSHVPEDYLAGRFAVKEAVFKALAPTLPQDVRCGFDLRIVETLSREDGSPYVNETIELKYVMECAGANTLHISITNENQCAVAFVIAERRAEANE